jgi:hypothetical protein
MNVFDFSDKNIEQLPENDYSSCESLYIRNNLFSTLNCVDSSWKNLFNIDLASNKVLLVLYTFMHIGKFP